MNTFNFLKDKENKSTYEWHCYHVFEDPEFLQQVKILESLHAEYMKNPNQKQNRTALLRYLDFKLTLPEIYKISHLDLARFRNPAVNQYFGIDNNVIEVYHDKESELIAMILPMDIKKKEYIANWSLVEDLKKQANIRASKVKATEHPRLIYSIFKAKLKGLSYKEIFELYEKGKLPGANEDRNSSLKTLALFRQYYSRYRP